MPIHEINMISIDNSYRVKNCPVCATTDIVKVGAYSYPGDYTYSSHILNFTKAPELWKCRSCNSGFNQNVISPAKAEELYITGDGTKMWKSDAFEYSKTSEVINYLNSILIDKPRVLEIGGNRGEFLDFASEKGCKTAGVEISEASRNMLISKGYEGFSSLAEVNESYDIIAAFDLIEHIYDLDALFTSVWERLRPGGAFIIISGNINSLPAYFAKERWWYSSFPDHVVFPSLRYYKRMKQFKLEHVIRTFASPEFENRRKEFSARDYIYAIRKRYYTGLPSFSPDHLMVTLKKRA